MLLQLKMMLWHRKRIEKDKEGERGENGESEGESEGMRGEERRVEREGGGEGRGGLF